MSDEDLPFTLDGAIRVWLGSVAFTLVLKGGDLMAEQGYGARFWVGVALVIAALPVTLSAALWRLAKEKLSQNTLFKLRNAFSNPRFLVGAFVVLTVIVNIDSGVRLASAGIAEILTVKNRPAATFAPKPPISEDEKQFRFDLRAFVLSDLQDQADAFGQLTALSMPDANPDKYQNENQRAAASELFQAILRPQYFNVWGELSDDVNKPIDEIDLKKTSLDLRAYFAAYSNTTEYFKDFLILSGINPHKFPPNYSGLGDPLAALVTADDKAIDSYGNLVTSPVAKSVGITPSGWFWASHTFQSFLTTSEPSDK